MGPTPQGSSGMSYCSLDCPEADPEAKMPVLALYQENDCRKNQGVKREIEGSP